MPDGREHPDLAQIWLRWADHVIPPRAPLVPVIAPVILVLMWMVRDGADGDESRRS
jgi:hypothetical protein